MSAVRAFALVAIVLVLPLAGAAQDERDAAGFLRHTPVLPRSLDLLEVGPRVAAFPGRYINDHTVVYDDARRLWHMFGIVSGETSFIHLTSSSLTQPHWQERAPYTDGGTKIWAPHIVHHDGVYFMFYTRIAVPREIACVESVDLEHWSAPRVVLASSTAAVADMKNKDPMILRDGDRWILYVSMLKDASHWVVGCSVSGDLRHWPAPAVCFDEDTTMPGVESPFVVRRGDAYYLFLSARPWPHGFLEVFRSASPLSWKVTEKVKWLDWHAPEVVRDLDGRWYITLCGYERERDGFSVAPLHWNDYRDDADTSVPVPAARQ